MAFGASRWIEFSANGVLADAQVTDFGASLNDVPLDWTLCLVSIEYGAAASQAIRLFFAPTAAATAETQKEIVNVTQQYFIWPSVIVPRTVTGTPYTLRVTRTVATNANIGYRYEWRPPGGC